MEGGFKNRVEESAMLMFMMRTNFNGFQRKSKKYPGRYSTAAGNMWWGENIFLKWEEDEIKFIEFLKSCTITQEAYENTSKWAGKDVWMYADPPYRLSAENYQASGKFDDICQLDLCDFMKDCNIQGAYSALSNREHHDGSKIDRIQSDQKKERKWISGGWFGDKFDDSWTMHMFMNHKYTAGSTNGEGCLATEILIKNY